MTKIMGPEPTAETRDSAFLQWTPGGMRCGADGTVHRQPAHDNALGPGRRRPQEVIETLRQGLPVAVFDELRDALEVSTQTLAGITNIAMRTLARRKAEGRLRKDESERVLRIGALFDQATEVLEGREAARQWLKSPKRALGGQIPLEYADTEPGARAVEELLIRLEYGVFS